jgi:hypothetical protein
MEGLTVYNLDVDNATAWVQWKYFRFTYSDIGDLVFLGLNINDQYMRMISAEGLPVANTWKADIRLASIENLLLNLPFGVYGDVKTYDFSVGLYPSDKLRLYTQFSHRTTDYSKGSRGALLIGAQYSLEYKHLSIRSFLEGRYYGADYNQAYLYHSVYYRPHRQVVQATDFVGSQLYPLMLYDRPYSKWPVYTEYQGHDITSVNLYLDCDYFLPEHFFIHGLLDLNYIKPAELEEQLLPFYMVGAGYEVLRDNRFIIGFTNRAMNLDKHFPDLYMLKKPALQFQFTRVFTM